jgi:hypothetical protein
LAVIALTVYWTGVVVAMHVLQPDFDPVEVPMSVYVLGPYGVWMTTSFFVAAAIWFLLGFGLARVLPATWWTKAGVVLYFIAGCGELLMGTFATQYPLTPPLMPRAAIHLLGALAAFYAIAFGSISFSVSFRGTEHWRPVSTAAISLSVLLFLALNYRWLWPFDMGMDGLMQRIIVALMLSWVVLVLSRWMRWPPKAEAAKGR